VKEDLFQDLVDDVRRRWGHGGCRSRDGEQGGIFFFVSKVGIEMLGFGVFFWAVRAAARRTVFVP
jgi:hypothetical protein